MIARAACFVCIRCCTVLYVNVNVNVRHKLFCVFDTFPSDAAKDQHKDLTRAHNYWLSSCTYDTPMIIDLYSDVFKKYVAGKVVPHCSISCTGRQAH